jgi:hypothetical protein
LWFLHAAHLERSRGIHGSLIILRLHWNTGATLSRRLMMSDLLFVALTGVLFALLRGFLEACTHLGGESATALRASVRSMPIPQSPEVPAHLVTQDTAP